MSSGLERTIVVGVDGSHDGHVAAQWAADEAQRRRLPLQVILAMNEPVPGHSNYLFPPPVLDAVRAVSRERLDATVDALRRQHPQLQIESVLDHADPRTALVAASRRALMTVVGTRGLGRLAEVLLGSVSLFVASHAHSAVVVVPSTAATIDSVISAAGAARPILVGIDGTIGSAAAVKFAFDEAAVRETELVAVIVFDDLDYRGFAKGANLIGRLDDDEEKAALAEELAGWRVRYPDVPVRQFVARGRPAETLLGYARHEPASLHPGLIVVGSRGRGGAVGLFLGSTSQRLITHSGVPVMVVRPERIA